MKKIILFVFSLAVLAALMFGQDIENVGPQKALELAKTPNTYLVDVRSVAEYVFVGHPVQAHNIPLSFWSETEQKLVPNDNFVPDLRARFKADDVLIFMCRSGGRSLRAAQAAQAAGFKTVINVTDGFEGKKDDQGHPTIGGWKSAGLPYSYDVGPALAYKRAPVSGSKAETGTAKPDPQAKPGALARAFYPRSSAVDLDPQAKPGAPATAPAAAAGREVAVMTTSLGTMVFKFFDADAPKTAAQFKTLIAAGFYNGKDFYRVVKGHVIQTGGGGAPKLPPEFNKNPHIFGTLGLGRTGDENSGDSEIYVCVAPRPHLDGKYTVFGQLIEGADVLRAIAAVPVEEIWTGPDKKMAMHKPLKPVVIEKAWIERRDLK